MLHLNFRWPRASLAALGLLLTLLLLSACGANSGAAQAKEAIGLADLPTGLGRGYPVAQVDTEPAPGGLLKQGETAPDFAMVLDDGRYLHLSDLQGRPVVLNLWATWCGPCLDELPEFVVLNRMYRKRPFKMVTISLDDIAKRDEALKALKDNKVAATNYILSADDRDAFAAALDQEWPGPVPYTMLIAPGGKVIYRKVGEINPLQLRRAVVDYLGRTY